MGWLSFLDFLAEPKFIDRRHPPLSVSAKVMGWIALALSALLLLALLGVGIGSVIQIRSHPTHFAAALVGFVLVAITQVLALAGSWQMTQGNHNGRRLVAQALILSVIASLIYNIGLSNLGQFVVQVVLRAVVYFFVVISRFPDEAASGASEGAEASRPS
jgi:uncharacterized membrane protein